MTYSCNRPFVACTGVSNHVGAEFHFAALVSNHEALAMEIIVYVNDLNIVGIS